MRRAATYLATVLLSATLANAQAPAEVSYSDDFQSYGTQANPPGWIDTSVGEPRPTAAGLYKTWPEPLDKNSPNIVYGTRQSSGKPEGNHPRIGTFSTLGDRTFSASGRFEYRGRFLRTNADTRIGVSLLSSYPEVDRYYLIGLWSQPAGSALTLQLFGFGAGSPEGTVDSNITPAVDVWTRFAIVVDDTNGATRIRARFWPDGQPEPTTFAIDATDASSSRLTSGRIGIWSAVKGAAYFDDLRAKSPIDFTAPAIEILESGNPLLDGAKFNRDAVPEIRVQDDLSTFSYEARLDGVPYTSLTPVTVEGWHTLAVTAVDGPGNSATAERRFLVDKTPPVIAVLESGAPFPAGFHFNRDVVATANVTDISSTIVIATLNGTPYTLGTPIVAEGGHTLVVTAVDEVGWTATSGPIAFVIDKTPPALTFTSHAEGAVLTNARATVIGGSDDAVTVSVNGLAATVNAAAKTFTTPELSLLEGANAIVATGVDRAGNVGTATLNLIVDTRAPELTIVTPAADACIDAAALSIAGTVADRQVERVTVTAGAESVDATLNGNEWSATLPAAEGKVLITVEARDASGHVTSMSRSVIVDRTPPAIEITSGGAPFTATLVNRPVSLFVRATDADPAVRVVATLDGNDYASGTSIEAEGTHVLSVTATDCAGHSAQKTLELTIDRTPPLLRDFVPANGGTVGTMPSTLTGRTDADTASIVINGTTLAATISGEAFTIAGVPFAEGTNRFALVATDHAGNRATFDYSVVVRTAAPVVEIRESGLPIVNGTLYNRAVTPTIRVAAGVQATIAATLNGAPFTSGTTISADGDYRVATTATDDLGHTGNAEATFSIDRTPPVVTITTPADGASIRSDRVEVRGNVGDAVAALMNGTVLTFDESGAYSVELPLDFGPNPITVTARDRAGNGGSASIVVHRDDVGTGIILTYPPDHSLTNRPTTDVLGRILSPGRATSVTIGTHAVDVDPTGAFRLTGYALTEGENTITATTTAANGVVSSATTHVTADFTPPALTILERGQPLLDGARFATEASLSLDASDAGGPVTTELTVDGTLQPALPTTVTSAGGHAAVATARDRAGNQSRAERMFFIGATSAGGDCRLESFDPSDGAVILSSTTTIVGRSGGAIGVKVNGVAALVADGGFSATVELPNEGPNAVTISCTDASGAPTGTPVTLTLVRVTGQPSISISTPEEGFVSAEETITVTGTVSEGVISADVNGTPATIAGTAFTATGVRLSDGLNVLVARGRDAAGRSATASRRGTYEKDAPSIAITAPVTNTSTGVNRIAVSGTYASLDPQTIVVTNVATGQSVSAIATQFSDTTGAYHAADVALAAGEQTLRVTGRNSVNRQAEATVVVRLTAGVPSIAITSPANHAYFPGGSETFTVTGTFSAAAGSTVDVNGSAATIDGATYTATARFSPLITPVVARVTEPSGASAAATVFVSQLADAPRVVEAFPAADAREVDSGALVLVLFSQPMDAATLRGGAFRLEDASGAAVSGTLLVDKDVLTFAPAAQLAGGATYTMRVSTAAQNLAGTALETAFASSFTVAASAPATAPLVDPVSTAVCGQSITVSGTTAPSARVRLESGALVLATAADAGGRFSFTYPLSGQSGFTLVRVRTVGADGSVSPAAELTIRVDCSGPQVLNATFDRTTNVLAISFSEAVQPATVVVGSSIVLTLADGTTAGGSAAVSQSSVSITPASDLRAKTFTLTVATLIEDTTGNRLVAPYAQEFATSGGVPDSTNGTGFISGEVYDATTGRPLPDALIAVDVASAAPVTTKTDGRGRYLARIPEGAHTIRASHEGHTTVWREIIVPAGAGVIPIDIRLTRRGDAQTASGSPLTLTHGADTKLTRRVELTVPSLPAGASVSLTSVGAQALTGLLPLGWSPLAAADIELTGAAVMNAATLTFHTPAGEVANAAQNLTAVHYDAARDEWRVMQAVVNVGEDGRAAVAIDAPGAYAVVYPDKAPGLTPPPLPAAGEILQGVPAAPVDAPALVDRDFVLDPPVVLPTGRTVATLRIEGAGDATFPSGTAVQAYIDEELRLADGSRLLDPPFATDLLLYRNLSGDLGVADFHLAPSARAAQVVLEIGFEHIRVLPYPGRLDRGTLIGSEGGRVPADDKVAIDIPTGAVAEVLRATATSLAESELSAAGSIPGFRVVGGFALTLQRATTPPPQDLDGDGVLDAVPPVELFLPARATFSVDASKMPSLNAQVVLAELASDTPYGRMLRLAVPMMPVDGTATPVIRFTTRSIDRSVLPVDGVVREGRYFILAAEAPIAFATGTLRLRDVTGRLLSDARVAAPPLGVFELTRVDGIYNIPVPATPAGPFSLVPRHTSTGTGATYTHASAVAPDSVTRVDLTLVPQPPVLGNVVVFRGDPPSQGTLSASSITRDVALTTNIRASFTPAIDPASITNDSIKVVNAITGAKVNGRATADGTVGVVWTLTAGEQLEPNAAYTVVVEGSIRGTNGSELGAAATYAFATVKQVLNTEVRREKIRITIPKDDGTSRITGDPGALPAGWQAVAVRRVRDFYVRYQATAAADGSFSFLIGDGDPRDRVTMADSIDLRVVSNIGNLAAIFALTPFVTEDGKGFVAPAGVAIRFTSPDGITIAVPEGAFDVPTIITVNPAQKADFLDIPRIEEENEYATSVNVEFDGYAKKPLDIEVPVPVGFDTAGKQFILAWKGMSVRGPRLAAADLLRVENGRFTSIPDEPSQNLRIGVLDLKAGTNRTLVGRDFRNYLMRLIRGGRYMVLDIRVPVGGSVGWAVMEGLQGQYDLMWDIFWSYYDPYIHVFERGGRAIPVLTGTPFTVYGIDRATGLQAFSRVYDPVPVGEPGEIVAIPSPQQNDGGPYPVFGSPFRVEVLDLDVEDLDVRTVRNFLVRLSNDTVQVSPSDDPIDGQLRVELMNVKRGTTVSGTAGSTLSLGAKLGDRVVLLIEQKDVDAGHPVSIVLNEPIHLGDDPGDEEAIDTYLHDHLVLEQAPEPPAGGTPAYTDITRFARFTVDSGDRRINIQLPGALQREAVYRLTLKGSLADATTDGPGLQLGAGTTVSSDGTLTPVGGGTDLPLVFHVRKPAGEIGSFTVSDSGILRGMDLYGNILFTGSLDGGLRAFDVSNPAAIDGSAPELVPAIGPPNTAFKTGALTVDRHGRLFTIADLNIVSVLRSYRAEDFANGTATVASGKASSIINWKLGYSSSIGLPSNTVLSDRPESIPYRLRAINQDDTQTFDNRELFVAGTGASETGDYPLDGIKAYSLSLPFDNAPYKYQRITVENVSLDMRWSADAEEGGSASFTNVVARAGDVMRVVRNKRTYAVVAHLGYGIGIYDANAMESNRHPGTTSSTRQREQLFLGNGLLPRECGLDVPTWAIGENYLNTDVEVRGDGATGDLFVFANHPTKGVLDYRIHLPGSTSGEVSDDSSCDQRGLTGLLFQTFPGGNEGPRIQALRSAVKAAGGSGRVHTMGMSQVHWSITAEENVKGVRGTFPGYPADRDYLLVSSMELGLIVVETTGNPALLPPFPLTDDHIADVIWIPGGAVGVRVMQESNTAVVTDRNGRVLLVDLSRIDERYDEEGNVVTGLFPTAAKAIAGVPSDPNEIGADDPRIIWKSEPGLTGGALAPLFDSSTGIIYGAHMTQRRVKAVSAIDPTVKMKVNLGDVLSDVGGVVPLGLEVPSHLTDSIAQICAAQQTPGCIENSSMGAFRLEVGLPGGMLESLGPSNQELWVAVESERIAGAVSEQTPSGFPRAHLRRTRRDGQAEASDRVPANFRLRRVVPEALAPALRFQRGYNKFLSPWIVAIADPRASEEYDWGGASLQEKEEAGCFACERPEFLREKTEGDGIYELYTNGRYIAVRPELSGSSTQTVFDTTDYDYLGRETRLAARFTTTIADTIRPTEVLVAAHNPPVATGMIAETIFLHSGELHTTTVDLNVGGRAGTGVTIDRIYRSRTLGGTVLGQGWDSALFRRLRPLPDGNVEYRDGADHWTFTLHPESGEYVPPDGLFLRLSKTGRGWTMIDQQWRVTDFDDLGRIVVETDEFYDPSNAGSGNLIRYVYDENGRLSQVVDPVNRTTRLSYWTESDAGTQGAFPGLIKEIVDWRDRKINYEYDAVDGTLQKAHLADVANTSGGRPVMQYEYAPGGSSFKDRLEIRTNLASIKEPHEVLSGGSPRLQFEYDSSAGFKRDRLITQKWGTGEDVSFTYSGPTEVSTTDVLGQTRSYSLSEQPTDRAKDRAHILSMTEDGVRTSSTPQGQLPDAITAAAPPTSATTRSYRYTYGPGGLLASAVLEGVYSTTFTQVSVEPEAPGYILTGSSTSGSGAPAISSTVAYQSGANSATFISAVTANGRKIDAPEPSRANLTLSSANDEINETEKFDETGLLTSIEASGGTDPGGAGASTTITYGAMTDAPYKRGMPVRIEDGGVTTTIEYASAEKTIETDSRGVVTTIEYDRWQRPVRMSVTGAGTATNETWKYDATGRIREHTRRQGGTDVKTTYTFDVMGRQLTESIDNVGDGGTETTSMQYDLPSRTVTTTHPGGGVTTTTLDSVGRPVSRITTTGGSPIVEHYAHDLLDNIVFETDLLTAAAYAYDAQGRLVGIMDLAGTRTTTTVDGFGRPMVVEQRDGSGGLIGSWNLTYTDAGRLKSVTRTAGGESSTVDYAWDGGGRLTGVSESGRAAHAQYDPAGRLLSAARGSGHATSISEAFERSHAGSHSGRLPQSIQKIEKGGGSFNLAMQFNAIGETVSESLGGLEWQRQYDEDGNVTFESEPRRGGTSYMYDSRGAVKQMTRADGATSTYTYGPNGALATYTDPANEVTSTTNDLIGRPISRQFKDGTTEAIVWEGSRVKSITDRQGRTQTFGYDARGKIRTITGPAGVVLDEIDYDSAGHIERWKTPDAVTEYAGFDADGRPAQTTQLRYRDGQLVDRYTQQHTYNKYGERTSWTMPTYEGFRSTNAWTTIVRQDHDAVGNLTRLERSLTSGGTSVLLEAEYRNGARPIVRKITTAAGAPIVRDYGYESGTGLPNRMSVSANGAVVAGSIVTFDGVQKMRAQMLGVSGGARADEWTYDEQGRLRSSILGRDSGSTPDFGELTAADFRSALMRTRSTPVDPPSVIFSESTEGGHKLSVVQRDGASESYRFHGAERVEDGQYHYEYDARGRLSVITQKSAIAPRRITYAYDGSSRVVGRRAEYLAPPPAGSTEQPEWRLEDRPEVLAADALPADATFVWDPIDDQLVAIFKAGASENPLIDDDGGLVRQIIHGGLRYDDPLEVAHPAAGAPNGVARLYPVYDEAGAGSLDAILNEEGRLVLRHVEGGPYGEDDASLRGPAIDRIAVAARRDANGELVGVDVTLRSTEDFAQASVAAGVRLAIVNGAGSVIRAATSQPALVNAAMVQWSFTPGEWAAFASGETVVVEGAVMTPAALSVAVTRHARAEAWSATQTFLPAPQWALETRPVYTSPDLPLETRESLAALSQWLASIPAGEDDTAVLFEVPSLYALATPRELESAGSAGAGTLIVAAPFHAHPFLEPMTGKSYVRARWFDPRTGTWLTPDPRGYVDSPNLYAYAAHDPVNRNDPTGELWGFVVDIGFAAWDTWSYATGRIDGKEYALRMALTGASVIANAATGGMGGGLAVRAAGMAGRAGRLARVTMRTAVLVNRTENAVTAAQAAMSLHDAVVHGDYTRGGISAVQIAANLMSRRGGRRTTRAATQATARASRATARGAARGGRRAAASVPPSFLTRTKRFFYDPRPFNKVSREYWKYYGKANGRSLHHWLFPQRMKGIPEGIRNAGFNTINLPAFRGVFHPTLGLNQWMGFAYKWGGRHARRADLVEKGIRVAIPASAAGAGGLGYLIGNEVNEILDHDDEEDEE